MKAIRTEVLEIAYLDDGPQDVAPLLLLHGWPESPTGFDEISPRLHEADFRTIAPFLRGFGATRFLFSDKPPEPAGMVHGRGLPGGRARMAISRLSGDHP
jgi:pimeloyl-ACP methyl ester carboxylesterase